MQGDLRTAEEMKRPQEIMELGAETGRFFRNVFPSLLISEEQLPGHLDKSPDGLLSAFRFINIQNLVVGDKEELEKHLSEKMSRLFTALHPLGAPVLWGVISYNGKARLVAGIQNKEHEGVLRSVLDGMLTGSELDEFSPEFSSMNNPFGGVISSVPVPKVDDEKQFADLSSLMRCMSGKDYAVLFVAQPYSSAQTGSLFSEIIDVRDKCAALCKRNISRQRSQSRTVSESETKSTSESKSKSVSGSLSISTILTAALTVGLSPSLGGIPLFGAMFGAGLNIAGTLAKGSSQGLQVGGSKTWTESSSKSSTRGTSDTVGSSLTISHDEQNGLAMELVGYCDRAIERIKGAINTGLWGTAVFYSAKNEADSKIIGSYLTGMLSKPSKDVLPPRKFEIRTTDGSAVSLPAIENGVMNGLLTPVSSSELGMLCMPPTESVPDFEIREEKLYPMIASGDGGIPVGSITVGQRPVPSMKFSLSEGDLARHTFVCGITGSGKTTTVKGILARCGKPFMVIESAKKEYRNISLPAGRKVSVYTIGKPEINCPQFNPFYVQRGINLQTHIDYLKDLFSASFSFYGPMTYILERCLHNIYVRKGWNIALGYHPYLVNTGNPAKVFDADYMKKRYALKGHQFLFPTMQDLKNEVTRYIKEEMDYEGEVAGNIKSAMLARLDSLCVGSKGFMFNTSRHLDMDSLLKENAVFELEGLADDSDKAFCVGLLIIFVNEYRQVAKEEAGTRASGLQHLLVIEEAHRLLKNVDTERGSEYMGNPKGKAVEHFTNMIAEMRSYGQGVIIAEQIPSKLAPDVIKNTSNKIIQRVVSADDQKIVANTVGIREDDAIQLGTLRTGIALCHKEGMSLPVRVTVDPVADDFVSDDMLLLKRGGQSFDDINYSIVRTSAYREAEKLALRLLNTIMSGSERSVMESVSMARHRLAEIVTNKGIHLVVCRNRDALAGRVIAEQLGLLLASDAYCIKDILSDQVLERIQHLMQGDAASLGQLRGFLKRAYGEEPRRHCIYVISELIKHTYSAGVNLRKSISSYFLKTEDLVLTEIESRVRKEMRV